MNGAARQAIDEETARLHAEDTRFIDTLDAASYLRYYLPLRKRISSVATLAQFRTDPRLYKSGLDKMASSGQEFTSAWRNFCYAQDKNMSSLRYS